MRTTPLLVTLATLASAALTSTAAPAGAAPTRSTTVAPRPLPAGRHASLHIRPALKRALAALPDSDSGVGSSFGLERP
ncbi:MAG TPA: hypothetical protein VH538_00795 [Gaiellaceae bacterium]